MQSFLCEGVLLASWVVLLIITENCTYILGSLTLPQLLQVIVPLHTDSENSQNKGKSVSLLHHMKCLQGQAHQRLRMGFQFVVVLVRGTLTAILLEKPQAGCIPAPLFQ